MSLGLRENQSEIWPKMTSLQTEIHCIARKIVFLQVFGGHRLVGFWWAPAATIGNYLLMFYQHHNIQKICTYRRGVQPSALGTFLNGKTQNVETKLDFSHGKIQNIKI